MSPSLRLRQRFWTRHRNRVDGLTVDLGSAWFNLRSSNTEPVLRLNAEAASTEDVAAHVGRISKIIEEDQ